MCRSILESQLRRQAWYSCTTLLWPAVSQCTYFTIIVFTVIVLMWTVFNVRVLVCTYGRFLSHSMNHYSLGPCLPKIMYWHHVDGGGWALQEPNHGEQREPKPNNPTIPQPQWGLSQSMFPQLDSREKQGTGGWTQWESNQWGKHSPRLQPNSRGQPARKARPAAGLKYLSV
jgi:hypothetical protein